DGQGDAAVEVQLAPRVDGDLVDGDRAGDGHDVAVEDVDRPVGAGGGGHGGDPRRAVVPLPGADGAPVAGGGGPIIPAGRRSDLRTGKYQGHRGQQPTTTLSHALSPPQAETAISFQTFSGRFKSSANLLS